MKTKDKGWLEGFIDGEGTISLYKNKTKYRPSRRGFMWHPKIRASNTDVRLLENMQRIVGGGKIYFSKEARANFKDRWEYQLSSSKRIINVLGQIALISKEKQRVLLIEACTLIMQQKPRFTPYDQRIEEIFLEIRGLNKRGRQ